MRVTAHRGDTRVGVENTARAIAAAARLGIGFEVDVRTTRDGRLMLHHDATLDRTTDGSGPIVGRTAAEVRRLRTADGQQVPYLRTVFAALRLHPRSFAVLDLKDVRDSGFAAMAAQVEHYGVAGRVQAISFDAAQLAGFRRHVGGRTFWILRPGRALPEPEELWPHGVSAHVDLFTERWVSRMAAAGLRYNARLGADRPAYWDRAVGYGTHFVMTDDVAAFHRHRETVRLSTSCCPA